MKTFKVRKSNCYSGMFETFQKEIEGDVKNNKKSNKNKSFVTCFIPSVPRNVSNDIVPLPIDQFTGKSFMKNNSGFPMNDIMAFETVQSDQLARAVLQRAQIVNFPKNEEMTLDEQFASIVPSNWSSPAEYLRASEQFAKMAYQKQMAEVARAQQAAQASQEKNEPESKVVHVEPE